MYIILHIWKLLVHFVGLNYELQPHVVIRYVLKKPHVVQIYRLEYQMTEFWCVILE